MRKKLPARVSDGLSKAYGFVGNRDKVTLEYKRLNTSEARAVFADHLIGVWAHDFETNWATAYELLALIEKDELYRNPQRVGPGAPGDGETHGLRDSYDSFGEYFTDRLGQPLERWAELESTYKYVQRYAPDFIERSFADANKRRKDAEKARNDVVQADANQKAGVNLRYQITKVGDSRGKSRSYLLRRLARHAPDVLERYSQGEFKSASSAARAAGIKVGQSPLQALRSDWKKASSEERETFRQEINE